MPCTTNHSRYARTASSRRPAGTPIDVRHSRMGGPRQPSRAAASTGGRPSTSRVRRYALVIPGRESVSVPSRSNTTSSTSTTAGSTPIVGMVVRVLVGMQLRGWGLPGRAGHGPAVLGAGARIGSRASIGGGRLFQGGGLGPAGNLPHRQTGGLGDGHRVGVLGFD